MKKRLNALYKQHAMICEEIQILLQARIVKYCDKHNYTFSGYMMEFKNQDGELIENKETDKIFELTNEQIKTLGWWDAQFHYNPEQFLGKGRFQFKAYNKYYMGILKQIKKVAQTL